MGLKVTLKLVASQHGVVAQEKTVGSPQCWVRVKRILPSAGVKT